MLRHALSIICTAILPTLAAAAPKDMTVYGRPPVGAFGVDTLEHVEGAAKLGMTLLYSYCYRSFRARSIADRPYSDHPASAVRGPPRGKTQAVCLAYLPPAS